MNTFDFYSPTMFAFGEGKQSDVGALVKRFGGTKVLLVYGSGSIFKNGAYDGVTASLKEAGIPFGELGGVKANPRSGKVYEGIDLCRNEGYDFLLAVGGGSTIDTAKAISVGYYYDGDFWDIFCLKGVATQALPIGVVLTISAAGSEGSDSAVISLEEGNLKWALPKTDMIRPKFSVLNPGFACSLPKYQIASGAVDMFAHVIERYFTPTKDVVVTDRLCEGLMLAMIEAAPKAVANPEDVAAQADLMWAGMLAHNNCCGVGRVQDWASHQVEHEMSALYDCAHGAGLAVVIPAWMEHVVDVDVARFVQFATRVMGCTLNEADPKATALEGIEKLRAFFKSLEMPTTFAEIGAKAEDIPEMVRRRGLKPNGFPFGGFTTIGPDDMQAILERCAQ